MWFLLLFFIESLNAQDLQPKPFLKHSKKLKAHLDCSSKKISLSLLPPQKSSLKLNQNIINNAEKTLKNIDAVNFLKKIENFLNSLKTLQGSFTEFDYYQENKGTFLFLRPSLMKMQYKKPQQGIQKPTIIIKNSTVIYYDHELKEKTSTTIFSSPLSFFFDPKVALLNNVEILDFMSQKDFTYIRLCKKDAENQESIALKFSNTPFMLREWRIFADKKRRVPNIVILFNKDIKINQPIAPQEFEKF